MKKILFFLFFSFFTFSFLLTQAQEPLKIGTIQRPPFSYKNGNEWTGFSIDLWKEIAQKNSIPYSFVEFKEFSKMIDATKNKEVDMSVANISITLDREKFLDFSQPIFDSGLNVMAIKGIIDSELYISPLVDNFTNILLYIALFFLGLTHFFRILNVVRGNIGVFSYFREIIPIFFDIVFQLKEKYGLRILFMTVLIGSVTIVSYYSQKISYVFADYDKNLTENNISKYNNIELDDLSKLKIGVTEASTSYTYFEKKSIPTQGFKIFNDMLGELKKGSIDVVVHDDPILRYFVDHEGKDKFIIVTKMFHPEKFGIAFPEESSYREQIDRSILELREQGFYNSLYKKYF